MRVKKAISEVMFSLLAFSREWKFGAVIRGSDLDINLLSSFLKCGSLKVNVFVFIHRKTLPMAEVVGKRGSSVVRHLPLVLEVPGSIPARGEKNFGVRTRFL